MNAGDAKTWGLFGGSGFIGQHLAHSIVQRSPESIVFLLDLLPPTQSPLKAPLGPYLDSGQVTFKLCDVRDRKQVQSLPDQFDVIVNLAAIHREPGHKAHEYFDTNIYGARNICELAESTNCREIIFTSSISVYGIHDQAADEYSQTQAYSPYGQSKLEAETIHAEWADNTGGRLITIRPGVVFGPGEGGNVTRLMKEMFNRKRSILLNPDQPKAGIYIRELVDLIHWLRENSTGNQTLVNGVSHELLTFNSFGSAFNKLQLASKKELSIPANFIHMATLLARPLSGLFSSGSRIHPERLAKIYRPNDIRPTVLKELGYPFNWPLERALQDWQEHGL